MKLIHLQSADDSSLLFSAHDAIQHPFARIKENNIYEDEHCYFARSDLCASNDK